MSRRTQRGSASLEFLGALPLILLAALAGIQLLLTTTTVTAAQNAARAGSRAAGLGATAPAAKGAALDALPSWLRGDARFTLQGTKATVVLEVPLVLPGLSTSALTVSRRAELPKT